MDLGFLFCRVLVFKHSPLYVLFSLLVDRSAHLQTDLPLTVAFFWPLYRWLPRDDENNLDDLSSTLRPKSVCGESLRGPSKSEFPKARRRRSRRRGHPNPGKNTLKTPTHKDGGRVGTTWLDLNPQFFNTLSTMTFGTVQPNFSRRRRRSRRIAACLQLLSTSPTSLLFPPPERSNPASFLVFVPRQFSVASGLLHFEPCGPDWPSLRRLP
ncbi:hypothetical protein BKA81DRAFT_349482 [Phyllosticta paracitricarpa]